MINNSNQDFIKEIYSFTSINYNSKLNNYRSYIGSKLKTRKICDSFYYKDTLVIIEYIDQKNIQVLIKIFIKISMGLWKV